MTNTSTMSPALQPEAGTAVHLLDNWFDAIEVGLRERVREFIQAMIESELEVALARPRYGRRPTADIENGDVPNGIVGHRHGHRSRSLKPAAGSRPLAYSSPEAVQTTGTVATYDFQGLELDDYLYDISTASFRRTTARCEGMVGPRSLSLQGRKFHQKADVGVYRCRDSQ